MIYWFTGQPGAGKTTLALALKKELNARGHPVVHLDGDILRAVTSNLDYSHDGRRKNIKAAQALASHIHADGVAVVAAFVSPYRDLREEFKMRENVLEIFVHTTARRGREHYFVADFEPPENDFLDLDTTHSSVHECVKRILDAVDART